MTGTKLFTYFDTIVGAINAFTESDLFAMKTYSANPTDITAKWWLVDAENVVLGRLAAEIAKRLRGKHKPMFTPHIDCGDNIIVVNAEKVKLTGRKLTNKTYYGIGHNG